MAVKEIFRRVAAKTGLKPSDPAERDLLAELVNEALELLYEEFELPETVVEKAFVVNNQEIALPYDCENIRAMRETNARLPWTLREQYSKYQLGTQAETLWFSWIEKGTFPINRSELSTPGQITITGIIEGTDVVKVVGKTATAERVIEEFSASGQGATSFVKIHEIKKEALSANDITASHPEDGVIAVIPNNQLTSQYVVVGVSDYPWNPQSPVALEMDVLYRLRRPYLYNDDDTFAGNKYDSVIVTRSISLWEEENKNDEKAILLDQKASRNLARKLRHHDKGKVQKVDFSPHPHDTLIHRNYNYRRNLYIRSSRG